MAKSGHTKGPWPGLPFWPDNDQYYFKTAEEMKSLFKDLPEAISNVQEVVNKIEAFDLARDVLLPAFTIPEEFIVEEDKTDAGKRGENAYLRHITYVGAKNVMAKTLMKRSRNALILSSP